MVGNTRSKGRLPALRLAGCALFRIGSEASGTIAIEAAMAMVVLSTLLVGVVDLGLAFSQEMAMANAVRAGTQFALVRHPSLGPSATASEALSSLATIRASVLNSAQALVASDPGPDGLDVSAFCVCPDGTDVSCTPAPGTAPICEAETHVRVRLTLPYSMMLRIPGLPETFDIRTEHSVRLN